MPPRSWFVGAAALAGRPCLPAKAPRCGATGGVAFCLSCCQGTCNIDNVTPVEEVQEVRQPASWRCLLHAAAAAGRGAVGCSCAAGPCARSAAPTQLLCGPTQPPIHARPLCVLTPHAQGAVDSEGKPVDAAFYRTFWGLQSYFRWALLAPPWALIVSPCHATCLALGLPLGCRGVGGSALPLCWHVRARMRGGATLRPHTCCAALPAATRLRRCSLASGPRYPGTSAACWSASARCPFQSAPAWLFFTPSLQPLALAAVLLGALCRLPHTCACCSCMPLTQTPLPARLLVFRRK